MRGAVPGVPPLPENLGELLHHLESTWPEEGCGVLLRSPSTGAWRTRPLRNAASSRTAYEFSPREWLSVLQEAEERGERLECVFHSHIDTGAYFSDTDRECAAPDGECLLPGVSYLVVAVHSGCVREARIFWWEGGVFQERPVSLES